MAESRPGPPKFRGPNPGVTFSQVSASFPQPPSALCPHFLNCSGPPQTAFGKGKMRSALLPVPSPRRGRHPVATGVSPWSPERYTGPAPEGGGGSDHVSAGVSPVHLRTREQITVPSLRPRRRSAARPVRSGRLVSAATLSPLGAIPPPSAMTGALRVPRASPQRSASLDDIERLRSFSIRVLDAGNAEKAAKARLSGDPVCAGEEIRKLHTCEPVDSSAGTLAWATPASPIRAGGERNVWKRASNFSAPFGIEVR